MDLSEAVDTACVGYNSKMYVNGNKMTAIAGLSRNTPWYPAAPVVTADTGAARSFHQSVGSDDPENLRA